MRFWGFFWRMTFDGLGLCACELYKCLLVGMAPLRALDVEITRRRPCWRGHNWQVDNLCSRCGKRDYIPPMY